MHSSTNLCTTSTTTRTRKRPRCRPLLREQTERHLKGPASSVTPSRRCGVMANHNGCPILTRPCGKARLLGLHCARDATSRGALWQRGGDASIQKPPLPRTYTTSFLQVPSEEGALHAKLRARASVRSKLRRYIRLKRHARRRDTSHRLLAAASFLCLLPGRLALLEIRCLVAATACPPQQLARLAIFDLSEYLQ